MDKTTETKKPKWKTIVGLLFGVALMVAGTIGVVQNDMVNNILVQAGAEQTTTSVLEAYPHSDAAILAAADAIDAAIQARETNPDKLVSLLEAQLDDMGPIIPVRPVLTAVISQINSAFKASDTEELYVTKLKCIVNGMRSAVRSYTPEEPDAP